MGELHDDVQGLRLLKAFLRISDPVTRQEIIEFAEAKVPPLEPDYQSPNHHSPKAKQS